MLSKMRNSAGSWMIKILLGLIVLAFVFMGVGSFNANRTNKAATVNGEPIAINEYQQTYQRLIDRLRQQFGQQLNNEMIKMFNVKNQAINQLIETELLRQAARRYNIQISPDELAKTITRIPAFQKKGHFDQQQYKMVLSQNRLSPTAFEAMQRDRMLIQKLQSIMSSGIQVSTEEARQWYNWKNTEIKINYAAFAPDDFSDVTADETELKTYYENHKTDYQTQPKIKARYVQFSPSDYLAAVDVADADIKAYYDNHQDQYKQPTTVDARHILLKLPKEASGELVAEKREKAREIMELAKSGKDFAELARTHSEGPSKDRGGDIGTFSKEDMVKPFADKAFSMQPGEISEPVRTQFGWHIIKVEKKTEASTKSLSAVEDKIRETLALQKAKNIAYDEALAMYNTSFSGDDLVKNSQANEAINVRTTDHFTRQKGPASVPKAKKFAKEAFNLPLMEVSDVTELGDAFYLIQVTDRQEEKIPGFDAVREQVTRDVKQQKQREAAKTTATEFLETAKSVESIQKAGETANIEIHTTDFFQRNQSIPGIGKDQALIKAAFDLSQGHRFPENPVSGQKAFYVIAFADKQTPAADAFDKEKSQVVQQLLNQKQSRFMEAWIAQLRQKSEIDISKQLLKS